jgi:hypothetical protein
MRKQRILPSGDVSMTCPNRRTSALRRIIAGIPIAGIAVVTILAGTAEAGSNGQHIKINGKQESVLVCGTNQRGDHNICETFNTPGPSTPDPNNWWWVGTVSIKGWMGPNETGKYRGEYFCNVPPHESGGDTVDCNTPWQ